MLGTHPDDSHSPGLPDEEYTGRDEVPSTIPAKRQRQRRTALACTVGLLSFNHARYKADNCL